jgi:hypothetical protein
MSEGDQDVIEKWLEITCDGCGYTETSTESGQSVASFRKEMKAMFGWSFRKGCDYCGGCKSVASGTSVVK